MAMSVDELKERYKILPVWARLAVAFTVGLAPGIYLYIDEGDALSEKLVEVQGQVQTNRARFEEARRKKANLPQLEEQMAYTEDQLAKAKLKLPDHIVIEDILQKTATIAKQTGVQLAAFNPSTDILHTQPYPYVEAPIATEIIGRFGQVATFLDQMIHLDGTIFMRRIELLRIETEEKSRGASASAAEVDRQTPYEQAQAARQNIQVRAKFDIVVFRSQSDQEQLAANGAAAANDAKTKKRPARAAEGADAAPAKGPPRDG